MARKHEAENYLRDGLSPVEIAAKMGVSVKTVIPYLFIRVGEGDLSQADIYFSISPERRKIYSDALERLGDGDPRRGWGAQSYDTEECNLYKVCRDAVTGDMYLHLRKLEILLHHMLRRALERSYCKHDDEWWVEGVPLSIRKSCQERREEDRQRLEAYAYTNLIHLKEIIDKQWNCLKDVLPESIANDRKELLKKLDQLNEIRNAVMHPVKMTQPSEDQFRFLQGFLAELEQRNWRIAS